MKNYLSIFLLFLFLYSCNKSREEEFSIICRPHKMYTEKSGDQLFKITLSDIDYIDWQNQSYKLKKEFIETLEKKDSTHFSGLLDEFFILRFRGKEIHLNLFNLISGNVSNYKNDAPDIYHFASTCNIYSKEGWVVFRAVKMKNCKTIINHPLFDKELFLYLLKNNKLNAADWKQNKHQHKTLENRINPTICHDLKEKFGAELFYHKDSPIL